MRMPIPLHTCLLTGLTILAGIHDVEAQGLAARDNACAVVDRGLMRRTTGQATGVIRKIPGFGRKGAEERLKEEVAETGQGPVCLARSQEELLLLTALMIDRSAMAAAKGIDAAQEALQLQRPLREAIAERERAANGFTPAAPEQTEVFVRQVSEEGLRLQQEIADRGKKAPLDEKTKAALATAEHHLNEVGYYGASAITGGTLFGTFMKSRASKDTLYVMLASPRIGLGSEFAAKLPERAGKVQATVGGSATLRNTINEVRGGSGEEAEAGAKRAKEQTQADAKRVQEGLRSMTLTSRDDS